MKKKTQVPLTIQRSSVKDVILDLGNSLWKGMIQGLPSTTVVIPHAIKAMDDAQFQSVQGRLSSGMRLNDNLDASQFGYAGKYYMVGENAESFGADTRRAGGAKYTRDYYGAAMVAMLLRLVPDGHDHIRMMAMFPPGDERFRDDLMKSLGGTHVVNRSDGKTITYKVKNVNVIDEPVGGIRHYLFANDGKHYRSEIPKGDGLCIDIGGKISTMVRFKADGWVDYANALSIDIGIQNVMSEVSRMLLSDPANKRYFNGVRGTLPQDQDMRDALITGIYPAGGYEISVVGINADATRKIRQEIEDLYINKFGGNRGFKFIMITGGGGGLLYRQLVEHVLNFNPDKVYLPGNLEDAHLWNLRGADKTVSMMMARGMLNVG